MNKQYYFELILPTAMETSSAYCVALTSVISLWYEMISKQPRFNSNIRCFSYKKSAYKKQY